ncbi:MAG: cobaltochelatase subunit CobT, partial [Pseudomonadota bacterium]|nr:cobaltochelatase subunit CobT [Pseudomonadota bacterium]
MSQQDREGPLEAFKRATTATMRALAGNDELEVTFGQGAPMLRGERARVPLPPANADGAQINAVRGVADAFALRLAHHDEALHSAQRPPQGMAMELFDAVEEARYLALGITRYAGAADKIVARLRDDCVRAALDAAQTRSEAPLGLAVGLMLRDRMTGRPLPAEAE